MKKVIQISTYFDTEDDSITYNVWMLNSTYLVTSIHGPVKEFLSLEEAEDFAIDLVS